MKAAIFDFDGTLFDSMWVWVDIDLMFLSEHGYTPTEEMRNMISNMSVWESAELFKNSFDISLSIYEIVSRFSEIAAMRYRDLVTTKPGAREYLKTLSTSGIPMCIATAASSQNVISALTRENILHLFDFILTSDEIKTGKTSPEIYHACAKRFNLPANEIMVFEDSLHCVKTAKTAGFCVTAVEDRYSLPDKSEIMKTADRYISTWRDLIV